MDVKLKITYLLFSILFLISLIFIYLGWSVDGFDFFKFQEQHFYFQSWISSAGILFSSVMAITTFVIYKKTKFKSLRYIPLSFLLTASAYLIIGYHSSYCKVCSDLGYCAASHNYSNYFFIITLLIFVLFTIISSHAVGLVKKAQLLQDFSYGLISATILLGISLFISLVYLELPDHISYLYTINLEGVFFLLPLMVISWTFIYFYRAYKLSPIYFTMALISSLSFLPQIFHVLTCQDCHTMECSEFYIFSGLIMLIVTGLFIHSVSILLQESMETK